MWRRMEQAIAAACVAVLGGGASAEMFEQVTVEVRDGAADVVAGSAKLLADRLREMCDAEIRVVTEPSDRAAEGLTIVLGVAGEGPAVDTLLAEWRCRVPDERDPGPEGFVLRMHGDAEPATLLAAAVDGRGALYAVGEILRRVTYHDRAVSLPDDLDVRSAPAFEVRGTQFDQGHTMLQLTGAREWTFEEQQRVILDYALAGANTFEVSVGLKADDPLYRFMKSFGLKTLVHYGPNIGDGPPEWQAKEGIGRKNYLCPSVPEARQALLERCENHFKDSPDFDYVRFFSGDGGGCECDRCKPYGGTYIRLCEELSAIIHRYHPNTEIFCTNEKTDNAGDEAIWAYLREKPRPWLRAFCVGCGSDAMTWQPGRRQDHRMDLFRYPGFGPYSRYPQEILHNLPPEQDLVCYNEVTHWWYSELGYVRFPPAPDANGDVPPHWGKWIYERQPDYFLAQVFHRRTFYAWPRYYHRVFNDLLRFGIGDVTHSSGHHDHFNQWMWQRLLWAPHTCVEDVVDEYSRAWFGPEAAPYMAQAVFQLEQNLGGSDPMALPTNEGVDRCYDLVRRAGEALPRRWMQNNWLWRQFMQKAALDKHVQLDARRQLALEERVVRRIAEALAKGDTEEAIKETLSWLEPQPESEEMVRLRAEADRLGEESDALFGVRNVGYFSLDHDFIGLGWYRKTLEEAQTAAPDQRSVLLGLVADYTNPGEGGFYDNAGDPNGAPHMVYGTPYDHGQQLWEGALSESNRPSQRLMAFTSHEDQGVTFAYNGLDPEAQYRVRFTLVRPRFEPFCADLMAQTRQSIYADEHLLAKDLELPEHEAEFFEFDIPPETTKDGTLTLRLEKQAGLTDKPWVDVAIWRNNGGWGTLVSEVWLVKKP